MISTKFRFLYLHVPKTGGNSIQQVLLPFSDDKGVLVHGQDGRDQFGITGPVTPHKHATLAEYESCAPGVAATHRVMISVRHPFDRALSAYFSPHRWPGSRFPEWDETAFYDLLDTPDLAPASTFLKHESGWRAPDLVLRFEKLTADFKAALATLGLPIQTAPVLPHLNRSPAPRGIWTKLRTSRVLCAEIETRFAEDMDRFGYSSVMETP
ncbi:MAG: sulfotransferase family 2 domain-containing protein [Paracoccaceae bacterium]|nr:sulfotransferase family 2 domain-containing protein [Paracoccaceae bacterium]